MASRSLGTLTLDLVAKIGGFVTGMTKAEREADKSLRNIEKKAKQFGKQLGTTLGIGISAAFTAGIAGITSAINRMDELRDTSIRLGIGVETLSAFSYAAKQLGTDIETLGRGFKILTKNIADASQGKGKAQLFEALGVSVKDAEGNLKSLEQIVPELADKISQLEDGTQKAAIMLELFGKAGLDLTEFFNQGGQGIQEFIDRARELGLVIDQDAADKADQFKDTLDDVKAAALGVATAIAIDLLVPLNELAKQMKEFSADGNKVAEVASNITSLFTVLGKAADIVSSAFEIVGSTLANIAATGVGAYDVLAGIVSLDFSQISRGTNLVKAAAGGWVDEWKEAYETVFGMGEEAAKKTPKAAPAPFSAVPYGPQFQIPGVNQFSAVPAYTQKPDTKAIDRALGGFTPAKPKGGGGKSDAEMEAEKIAKAIREMTEAQREWQSELTATGNQIADDYAKRLAEITKQAEEFARDGVPTDKIATFRSEMEKLAEAFREKETIAYLEEFSRATEDMVLNATGASTASVEYARSIEELNKELEKGIITQDLYNERAAAYAQIRDASANQVLADIQMQRDMLGQTAEYQDTYNKLIAAGVTANSEFGQAIIAANAELHNQATAVQAQVDMMDAFRDSVKGLFQDVKDGASVWDALKDAVDRFADSLFNIILNNLVQRAFGEYGSASGGSSGGWLATAASLIFGGATGASTGGSFVGPRAIGGQVSRGMLYEVNENSAEVLSMGGRDYLMMGGANGQVHAEPVDVARSSGDVNIQFLLSGRPDPRTEAQIAAKVGFETQRAMKRNGR